MINDTTKMTTVTNETPIAMLTVGQLKEVLNQAHNGNLIPVEVREQADPAKRYVYGLGGIRRLFGVSHTTAQRYKDTFLKEAERQNGKKIVVDADKALELFNKQGK